jgi:hypothetical protein
VEAFLSHRWILASSFSCFSRVFSLSAIAPSVTTMTPGNCLRSCSRAAGVAAPSAIVNVMHFTHEGMPVSRMVSHGPKDSLESLSSICILSSTSDNSNHVGCIDAAVAERFSIFSLNGKLQGLVPVHMSH